MSRKLSSPQLHAHKWKAIASWNDLHNSLIKNKSNKISSKSDKLSFWLETFSKYQEDESSFKPSWRPKYKRGDIIKVDFGFNVGREYGGLHYAIVINKSNARSADVLTVIPLTSKKLNRPLHPHDVDLGEEIYDKLYQKYLSDFNNSISDISVTDIGNNKLKISVKIDEEPMEKIMDEIKQMKKGSIALVEQIATISKMRIHNPRNTNDTLYGVRLSDSSLDKINDKLKELFIF